MGQPSGQAWRHRAERALFGIALALLGVYAYARVDAALYGFAQDRRLDHALREGPAPAGSSRALARPGKPRAIQAEDTRARDAETDTDGLIGRLEAPRLGLRAVVAEGTDARTLRRGIGHVPGTAAPGEAGNVALAAHRDGVFRVLERVREGDTLRLVTRAGAYVYVVDSAEVVPPDRVDVLDATPEPTLTLVTCYPFYMVGPAPQRFVVRARQAVPVSDASIRPARSRTSIGRGPGRP